MHLIGQVFYNDFYQSKIEKEIKFTIKCENKLKYNKGVELCFPNFL